MESRSIITQRKRLLKRVLRVTSVTIARMKWSTKWSSRRRSSRSTWFAIKCVGRIPSSCCFRFTSFTSSQKLERLGSQTKMLLLDSLFEFHYFVLCNVHDDVPNLAHSWQILETRSPKGPTFKYRYQPPSHLSIIDLHFGFGLIQPTPQPHHRSQTGHIGLPS